MAGPAVPSGKRPPPPNARSSLLSEEENQTLFKLVGNRVTILAAAVVQVFTTKPPNHNDWVKAHCGVATFSKDSYRRSHYIQVYDVISGVKLFEQELYQNLTYDNSLPFFHQFQGDDSVIGLSFADETEAASFYKVYQDRNLAKQRKREERKRQQNRQNELQQRNVLQPQKGDAQLGGTNTIQSSANFAPSFNKYKTSKGRKNIRKEEIGQPTDFRHITHVGFDPDNGFAQFSEDESLQKFFQMVGVDHTMLDPHTRNFIYDFIDKNGGIEQAKRETQNYSAMFSATAPAAAPANNNNNNISYSDHKAAPPPPPPVVSKPPPPSLPARNAPPPPPRNIAATSHAAPPPPPPSKVSAAGPPLGGGRAPPPPPAVTHCHQSLPPASLQPPDARSQLLDQIRGGAKLKKVEVAERAPVADSRSQLLDQIRGGVNLKRVENEDDGGVVVPPLGGLAGALAEALHNRAKVIQGASDDDDDTEDEDEEEWEED
ncbi:neural Wiskott-Aldrich syndrome protein [Hyalella azteca]|uniref:Neural Wiskott-Aldrich syndrome protein n=1 Tax=Hyalella azteca TaxID=294128 RepID=A0A8B7N294_HYAAZ|nr:neural Wiskott-Aldrich syndrome protein [Hyalella azteca]